MTYGAGDNTPSHKDTRPGWLSNEDVQTLCSDTSLGETLSHSANGGHAFSNAFVF